MDAWRRLLPELIAHHGGNKQDLARAIGITPSTLSHLLADGSSAPGVEVCLRLAHATGHSPSKILRAAGREAIADLLEDLYGPAAERRAPFGLRLTPHELQHVTTIRRLDRKTQRAYFTIVEAAAAAHPAPKAVATFEQKKG